MQKQTATVLHCARWLAVALLSTASLFAGAAPTQEIRIGGGGVALGTMRLLADAFIKRHPDMKVTVLPDVGTSGAIKAVPKGALDIGVSSRTLTQDERKLGATALEYARTLMVFVVSTRTPATTLTLDQLAEIYSGKMVYWPDGSLIRLVLREAGDESTRQIKQMSPALEKALLAAEQRPGMSFATTAQEAADKVAAIPGALGYTTLSAIYSENRPLRALALNGIEPTVSNGASGKYPHVRRLFLLTRSERSAAVERFVAFLQSAAGRDILIRAGHWIP